MTLEEMKELRDTLEIKVKEVTEEIREGLKEYFENKIETNLVISYVNLKPLNNKMKKYIYFDMYLVDESNAEIFGTGIGVRWFNGNIETNIAYSGTITVLGNNLDKYQCAKYKLLNEIITNAEKLNKYLGKFDLDKVGEFYELNSKITQLEREERKRQEELERKRLEDSIKVGNVYEAAYSPVYGSKKEVTKIASKRFYFKEINPTNPDNGKECSHSKLNFLNLLEQGIYKLIQESSVK